MYFSSRNSAAMSPGIPLFYGLVPAVFGQHAFDQSYPATLPGTIPVCYKPFMRKWMRERMKRRKGNSQKAEAGDAAKAPLQPAYFDASTEQPSEPSPPETPSEAVAETPEETPEVHSAAAPGQAVAAGADAGGEKPMRRRRRRGRGGRGRTRPAEETQPPPQPSPTESSEPQLPPAPVPTTAEAAPRKPKGVVVLAIGLPGSGKSSWFKRHNINPLSSDMLRLLLFDDPTEQRFQDLVFSNLRSMLKARLIARRPMNYVDATNLSAHDRRGWIKLAQDFGYEVHAVYFDVPLEVCLERNQRRDRVVADDVMHRLASKLRPPSFEEGFAKITVVRVKRKEGGPVE
jgi:predicted kinase